MVAETEVYEIQESLTNR